MKKVCSVCGTCSDRHAEVCTICGTHFETKQKKSAEKKTGRMPEPGSALSAGVTGLLGSPVMLVIAILATLAVILGAVGLYLSVDRLADGMKDIVGSVDAELRSLFRVTADSPLLQPLFDSISEIFDLTFQSRYLIASVIALPYFLIGILTLTGLWLTYIGGRSGEPFRHTGGLTLLRFIMILGAVLSGLQVLGIGALSGILFVSGSLGSVIPIICAVLALLAVIPFIVSIRTARSIRTLRAAVRGNGPIGSVSVFAPIVLIIFGVIRAAGIIGVLSDVPGGISFLFAGVSVILGASLLLSARHTVKGKAVLSLPDMSKEK